MSISFHLKEIDRVEHCHLKQNNQDTARLALNVFSCISKLKQTHKQKYDLKVKEGLLGKEK